MRKILTYWFWPNPGGWQYADRKIFVALVASGALILLSFIIRFWRSRTKNPTTRNLSASWSAVSFWFGLVSVVLIVSRVEEIQFLSMRVLWLIWFLSFALYLIFQILQFRRRHYTLLERVQVIDEREKYLPRKK